MPKPGPRKVYKYGEEFKATAVRLIELEGVQVQEVAEALDIHPFMLSRWRKESREGLIVTKKVVLDTELAAELKELRKIKKQYSILQMEHDLLKKSSSMLPIAIGNLRLHRQPARTTPHCPDVPGVRGHAGRLLCLATASPLRAFH